MKLTLKEIELRASQQAAVLGELNAGRVISGASMYAPPFGIYRLSHYILTLRKLRVPIATMIAMNSKGGRYAEYVLEHLVPADRDYTMYEWVDGVCTIRKVIR